MTIPEDPMHAAAQVLFMVVEPDPAVASARADLLAAYGHREGEARLYELAERVHEARCQEIAQEVWA